MEEEESPAASRSNRQNTLSQLNTAEHLMLLIHREFAAYTDMTLGRRCGLKWVMLLSTGPLGRICGACMGQHTVLDNIHTIKINFGA